MDLYLEALDVMLSGMIVPDSAEVTSPIKAKAMWRHDFTDVEELRRLRSWICLATGFIDTCRQLTSALLRWLYT
jgi:hypothetical protein